MNILGYQQAEYAFQRCVGAFDQLNASGGDEALILSSWEDFLTYHCRVFNKLRTATRQGPGKGWFDRKSSERMSDDLLSYLLHARNSLEHRNDVLLIVKRLKNPVTIKLIGGKFDDGSNTTNFNPNWHLCVNVIDRGRVYEVPKSHLGVGFEQSSLSFIGRKSIPYLEGLLEEARRFF